MNVETHGKSVIDKISAWWAERRHVREELSQLSTLSSDEIAEIAADCGFSTETLLSLVRAGPHASDEMNEMMQALGVDADAVQANQPELFREMQVVCSQCGKKGTCRQHLDQGTAKETFAGYCNNAQSLSELRAPYDVLAD